MLSDHRFVIVGLSRLTVRVASALADRDAEVLVVPTGRDDLALTDHLPPGVTVAAAGEIEDGLHGARLDDAECLLALDDDDLENLGVAVAANALVPGLPIVLRGYNAGLVEDLPGLNVRRAYSVSALAAPAFVAAALGAEVIETLRLGEAEVPICSLEVAAGSPLAGLTAPEVKARYGCGVLVQDSEVLDPGDQVVVGGPLMDVLRMAKANAPGMAPPPAPTRREERRRAREEHRRHRDGPRVVTLLPLFAAILALLLVAVVLVFAVSLDLGFLDALYAAVLTALGSPTVDDEKGWLKLVVLFAMIAGGALLGIFFSYLASVATVNRWERRTARAALRLSGHAVVTGLGTIGYRIVRILGDLGFQTAVIDRAPDPRFAEALDEERTLVLVGDARLREHLERARMADAVALFACTDGDLANIETCLQARRLRPGITTVARMFDERLADRMTGALGIDRALSASKVAAGAFVGAATDERAVRRFLVGAEPYVALRREADRTIPREEVDRWRADGARVLAFRRDGEVHPPSEITDGLAPGDSFILAGPRDAVFGHLGLAPVEGA